MTYVARSALFFLALLLSLPATASLVLSTPDQTSGTGLGAVNTVLTVQQDGSGPASESGCVAYNGMSDLIGPAACPPGISGGNEKEQTQTRSIGELGLTSAFNLRLVFNYNESTLDNITLNDLVLSIYSNDGTLLFDSGAFTARTFDEPFSGTGNAGFVYRLDAAQAAEAQQFFGDPSNRIGLAASLSGADSGNETFFISDAAAIGVPSADVSISKTDSPDPVVSGATLTYTLTARNAGPNTATGVTVVDVLPGTVTLQSATTPDGTCSTSGRTVTCALGSLTPGSEEAITIVVTTSTPGTITNSATVTANESDANTGNNSDSETTRVIAAAEPVANLSITKTDSADPVDVGDTFTYTVVINNAGPDAATGVTLTDSVPQSFTIGTVTASSGSCTTIGQTVSCDFGTIANGGAENVQIEVTATQPGTFTNTASTSANEPDGDSTDNSTSETTTVTPEQADLSITKTDSADPVATGATLTYTLTISNGGPDAATGVVVNDNLPANTTFQSATPSQGSCGSSGQNVSCTLGTIASGANATVQIQVTADAPGTLTNNASTSSDTPDPDNSNNNATETTVVDTAGPEQVDLSIVKTDSPDPVRRGNDLLYTLTIGNAGPDTATGVVVNDSLPSSVTINSVTPSQGSCSTSGQNITCALGSVVSGGNATVLIRVTPQLTGTITNTSNVGANEADTNTANNSDSETTTVTAAQVDLVVSKRDNPDPVVEGENISYTIDVTNLGPDTATGVTFVDTLPFSVIYNSVSTSQGSCVQSGRVVSCSLGSIIAGGSATVVISVTTTNVGVDQTITNVASASSDESDSNPANNADSETTTVLVTTPPRADLSIVKTDSVDPASSGVPFTYTLTVTNNGPDVAVNTAVTDTLPASVTLISASTTQGTCAASGQTVGCELGDLASGALATITITVTPNSGGSITNTASTVSDTADTDNSNNTDTESTTVGGPAGTGADLTIDKTSSPAVVAVGQPINYTLTVRNNGPDQATGVEAVDTLPASVTFQSVSSSQGSCSSSGRVVTCALGTLGVSATATVSIIATPTAAGDIVNVAVVSGDQSDSAPASNQDNATTAVAATVAEAIPTLGGWMMILLTSLIGLVGFLRMRI